MKCHKCGADLSESPIEVAYLKEANMDYMAEQQRIEYVNQVLLSIAEAVKKIVQAKTIGEKARKAQEFIQIYSRQSAEILTAILYAFKPEFRHAAVEIFKATAGIEQQVQLPQG